MYNHQKSQIDLIIILIAILCIISANLTFFKLDTNIKYILSILLFFIPGYALIVSMYPYDNFSKVKKVFFSVFISFGIIFLIFVIRYLFFNSLIIEESNLVILLSLITIFFVIIGYVRRIRIANDFKSVKMEKTVADEEKVYESTYFPKDLVLILLLSILSLTVFFTPLLNNVYLLTIIALPFLVYLPGYSLIAVLYLKKNDLEDIERLGFSFGVSVLLAPIVGLILNYTPFGIKLTSILAVLLIFTILMCVVAYIRRWKVDEKDRFIFKLKNM